MALNLTQLTQYVDQESQGLISKAVLEANTVKYIDIWSGIKYAEAVNILDINPYIVQSNNAASAGFTDSGTTVLYQVNAVACPLKIQNQFALEGVNGLEQYWIGMVMKAGSYVEDVPQFEEAFMSLLQKYTMQAIDYVVWLGSYNPNAILYSAMTVTGSSYSGPGHSSDTAGTGTTGTYGYLGGCQGILYNLLNVAAANGSATTITYSGAPTVATIYNQIETIVGALPSNVLGLDNLSIWCPVTYVDYYKRALFALNNNTGNYWIDPAGSSTTTGNLNMPIPGRANITLRGTIGLNGPTGNGYQGFVCTNDDNLVFITDLQNDYEGTKIWYSYDFDQLRATTKFKAGGQVKFPSQVVIY